MLLSALLLALLGASAASPELDAFLRVVLQASAGAAVTRELDPLLLPSGRVVTGLSGLRIEGLERSEQHRKFRFTAKIPAVHLSAKSSKGVVLLLLRNLQLSFVVRLAPSGSCFVLSSLSALLPPHLSDSRALVSDLARRPSMHGVADACRLVQRHLLDLFKSQLKNALKRHTIHDIHAGRFSITEAVHDTQRVRAVKDAVASAMVALRDRRPFFWRDGWRRFRLTTATIFADPEASQRRDALLVQLELQGLRLVERRAGRVRRAELEVGALVVLQRRHMSVRLTGVEGRANGAVLQGLLAWVATELTPALRRALEQF